MNESNVLPACITTAGIAVAICITVMSVLITADHHETARICIEQGATWVESGCIA
jgi:hypothetical protein